jgi:hypothetical protein
MLTSSRLIAFIDDFSYLPLPVSIARTVDTAKCLSVEPELVVAGVGVDDVGAIILRGKLLGALRVLLLLGKHHGDPKGDEVQ